MDPNQTDTQQTTAGDGWFKTTHWSVVLSTRSADPAHASQALTKLCETYWLPLYSYVRRSGHGPEDSKDLTQEFFARLLEKDYLKSVIPDKGKFRSFLLMALKRFLANEWDRANRLKRGAGQEIISLDAADTESRYLAEPVDDLSPEKLFERRWATTLLAQVLARLEAEFDGEDKARLFAELKIFLTGDTSPGCYPEISQKLGMTEGALRVNVHRLRQRYRDLLRLEIANTVQTPDDIDDEIRHLVACLS